MVTEFAGSHISTLPSYTPLQVGDTGDTPISIMCLRCLGHARAFVNTSAVCSGSQQVLTSIISFSTTSLIQCHLVAICLNLLWNCGFLTMAIEPSLSPLITVGLGWGNPSSSNRFLSQHTSHPASDRPMYLASVEDKATVVCFLDPHIIAPPPIKKM
jgi:hypothetical protein